MKTDFRDLGHLQYYDVPRTRTRTRFCVTAKKEKEKEKEMKQTKDSKKKKLKLLQDLSQNLSVFADTDFGLDFSQLHSPQVSVRLTIQFHSFSFILFFNVSNFTSQF